MRIEENDTQLIVYFSGEESVLPYLAGVLISFVSLDMLDLERAVIHWLAVFAFIAFVLFVLAIWRLDYCAINGRFVFDRQERVLYTIRPAFWGAQESADALSLSYFEGVRSYILQKPTLYFGNRIRELEWEMNAIELLTPEPVRGVLLHWLPPMINKQGAFKKERLENPDAALLAQRLSQFLGLTNHGFVGEKQRTSPFARHSPEKSQFERMFF
ncbi:MAG: hypothetical protein Q4A11_01645 [Brachymonas sp.]|nr:hypothetical protein [Brachymonas sp.]